MVLVNPTGAITLLVAFCWGCSLGFSLLLLQRLRWSSRIANMTATMPNMVSRCGSGGGSRGTGWTSSARLLAALRAVFCGGWLLGGSCD